MVERNNHSEISADLVANHSSYDQTTIVEKSTCKHCVRYMHKESNCYKCISYSACWDS